MASSLVPLNLKGWIDDHRDLLRPPVGNQVIWQDSQFIIMIVGGPNSRRDFHIDPGDEFFYQLEGDMVLEFMDPEVMVEIAGEDTPAEHPPILSLQPMEKAEGSFPRLEHNEEEAWNSLCLKLSGKVGDEKREMGVKLVFEGIGDL